MNTTLSNPQCIHIPDGSVVISGELFDHFCGFARLEKGYGDEIARLTSVVTSLQNECERLMTELDQYKARDSKIFDGGWQPIETAPKEHCTVVELAWDPDDWTTGDGFYFQGKWIAAAFFHSESRARMAKGSSHEIREWICNPTHWRPRRSDHPPALKVTGSPS